MLVGGVRQGDAVESLKVSVWGERGFVCNGCGVLNQVEIVFQATHVFLPLAPHDGVAGHSTELLPAI